MTLKDIGFKLDTLRATLASHFDNTEKKLTTCTICGKQMKLELTDEFYEALGIQLCSDECSSQMRQWLKDAVYDICKYRFLDDLKKRIADNMPL